MFNFVPASCGAFGLIFLCVSAHAAQPDQPKVNAADAQAFRETLAAKGLTEQWSGEPQALSSDALSKAYPGTRFFYTFKPRPLPPGAPMPELIAEYKAKMEEYRKDSLRIAVGIKQNGTAVAYQTAKDFNVGLVAVKSEESARTAAAAILSLMDGDQIAPAPVPVEDVKVEKTENGWSCRVAQTGGIAGRVFFDEKGQVTQVAKGLNFTPPTPP